MNCKMMIITRKLILNKLYVDGKRRLSQIFTSFEKEFTDTVSSGRISISSKMHITIYKGKLPATKVSCMMKLHETGHESLLQLSFRS